MTSLVDYEDFVRYVYQNIVGGAGIETGDRK